MSGHKLAKCTSFSKLCVWQCSGSCHRKEQSKFVEALKKSREKVKHNLHITRGVLSQHYQKLNDCAHYLNTLFCSWTTALHIHCQPQEKPHQKNPADPRALCYQAGLYGGARYMLQDLEAPPAPGPSKAVFPFQRWVGNQCRFWWQGEQNSGRRMLSACLPPEQSVPQNAEGLVPFKETNAAIL